MSLAKEQLISFFGSALDNLHIQDKLKTVLSAEIEEIQDKVTEIERANDD